MEAAVAGLPLQLDAQQEPGNDAAMLQAGTEKATTAATATAAVAGHAHNAADML
jgi:hypothetical protein